MIEARHWWVWVWAWSWENEVVGRVWNFGNCRSYVYRHVVNIAKPNANNIYTVISSKV